MKISVIIPTLNEQEVIAETVRTASAHAREHLAEVIVVDGGSSDETCRIAEEAGARVCRAQQKGRARQMNRGAAEANSEIYYFLHADTLPPRGYDRKIVEACAEGSPAGCFRLAFDSGHPLLRFYAWWTRFDWDMFRFGDQSLFCRRELFDQVGGFDNTLIVMEDNIIVRRIKSIESFTIIPEYVVTSSRKYHQNGVLRLQLVFTLIYTLYFLGLSQDRLVSIYKRLIKR